MLSFFFLCPITKKKRIPYNAEKRKKGFENGFQDRKRESKLKITKKMLEDDVDIEFIVKYTQLSIEQIGKLEK